MNFVVATGSLTSAVLIGVGGTLHLFEPSALARAIERIGLTRSSGRALALAVAIVEVGLALGMCTTFILMDSASFRRAGFGLVILGMVHMTWTARLVLSRSSLPCGCTNDERPANPATVLRAGVVLVGGALATFSNLQLRSLEALDIVYTVLAAVSLSLLLWVFPTTLGLSSELSGEPS